VPRRCVVPRQPKLQSAVFKRVEQYNLHGAVFQFRGVVRTKEKVKQFALRAACPHICSKHRLIYDRCCRCRQMAYERLCSICSTKVGGASHVQDVQA
jgi:molybdopterin synthase catalytic subunit